jgi:polyhydroxyalkanoate synthesis regulator phasin
MNADNLVQLLQNGFRVTLGATASLVEVIQDSEKRHENLSKLNQEWSVLSSEWAQKGEVTEQEARNFVDTLLAQRANQQAPYSSTTSTTATTPSAAPEIQLELQELTAQIAAMRAELETLRNQNAPS